MRERQPAVYIMASQRNGTVYTGVTSALVARVWQHKNLKRGFAGETGCNLLVWFELHGDMTTAIAREKQIKGGGRKKKLALIEANNPQWRDLWPTFWTEWNDALDCFASLAMTEFCPASLRGAQRRSNPERSCTDRGLFCTIGIARLSV